MLPATASPQAQAKAQGCSSIYSLSERSIIYMMTMAATNTWFSTPQGWVLVMGEVSETWLWHPLTGDTIALPPIHDDHCIPVNCKCLLTHASVTHPDCAVVLLDVAHPLMWFCRVNNGGTTDDRRRWGQHTYDIGDYELPEEHRTSSTPTKNIISEVAALKGKLHFTSVESGRDKLCMVDLGFPTTTDDDQCRPHPPTAEFHKLDVVPDLIIKFPHDMCSGTIYLVESMEELFAVCVCFVDFDPDKIGAVLIYKMKMAFFSDDGDDSQQEPYLAAWSRVYDIGDRVFLLTDNNMGTWCSASANNLNGNTVYFLKNGDVELCIYDVQGQTMEVVQVHNQDLEIVRTKPYWINVPPC